MKYGKKIISLATGLVIIFLFPALSLAARGVTDTEIKIGWIGDMTGPTVVVQKPYLDGMKNAIRNINDTGGINGRKIKFLTEDNQYQAAKAVGAFKKLVKRDKVMSLIGPSGSASMKALYTHFAKEKVPTIGPMSTTADMLDPFKREIFVVMSTYQDQIKVIVDYIMGESKGKKPKLALVTQHNNPGKICETTAREATRAMGLDLTVMYLPFGSLDATSQVLLLKKAAPDFVIIQGNIGITVALLRDAKKLGLKSNFIGTFSTFSEHTYMKSGDAAKNYVGVHSINSWDDSAPGVAKMREITLKYEPGTEKKIRSRYYVQGFATVMVMAEGLRRAGRDINAEKYIQGLESIRDFDTKGLCGPISYSSKSHKGLEYVRVFNCVDYKKGKLVPVTGWMKPSR